MFLFKQQEKTALDEAVRSAAAPATRLFVTEAAAGELSPLATQFGGPPYAENGDTWPTWGAEKRPYDFVCQINLRECPVAPDVPFDLIQIFLCWSAVDEADVEESCLVRAHIEPSPSRAVELPRPAALDEDDYRISPCRVEIEAVQTYPWLPEQDDGIMQAASRFRDPYVAYQQARRRIGYRDGSFSRIGGFPEWVHDNTLGCDEMVFIAQIEYEPPANNCIGDAAPIFVAVSASDPRVFETDIWQTH